MTDNIITELIEELKKSNFKDSKIIGKFLKAITEKRQETKLKRALKMQGYSNDIKKIFGSLAATNRMKKDPKTGMVDYVPLTSEDLMNERNKRLATLNHLYETKQISETDFANNVVKLRRTYQELVQETALKEIDTVLKDPTIPKDEKNVRLEYYEEIEKGNFYFSYDRKINPLASDAGKALMDAKKILEKHNVKNFEGEIGALENEIENNNNILWDIDYRVGHSMLQDEIDGKISVFMTNSDFAAKRLAMFQDFKETKMYEDIKNDPYDRKEERLIRDFEHFYSNHIYDREYDISATILKNNSENYEVHELKTKEDLDNDKAMAEEMYSQYPSRREIVKDGDTFYQKRIFEDPDIQAEYDSFMELNKRQQEVVANYEKGKSATRIKSQTVAENINDKEMTS